MSTRINTTTAAYEALEFIRRYYPWRENRWRAPSAKPYIPPSRKPFAFGRPAKKEVA